MASKNTTEVKDEDFQQKISEADKPVLVDFWAPWCGPCQMLGPIIDEVADEMANNAFFYKLNVDDNPQTAGQYNVMSIPTVIIYKNGEIKESFIGVQSKSVYVEGLKKHM